MEINEQSIIENFAECGEQIIKNYVAWKSYQWECRNNSETPQEIKEKFENDIYYLLWDRDKPKQDNTILDYQTIIRNYVNWKTDHYKKDGINAGEELKAIFADEISNIMYDKK